MATLTASKSDTPEGAAHAGAFLVGRSKELLISIYDAATVEWQPGKMKPKTRQANNLTGAGALDEPSWRLFGIVFLMPLPELAIGTASGALGGGLADAGIDEDFIASATATATPGTPALFLLSSEAVREGIEGAFEGVSAELIHTNLSNEEEAELRAAFADED